jgi:hypothetical protein
MVILRATSILGGQNEEKGMMCIIIKKKKKKGGGVKPVFYSQHILAENALLMQVRVFKNICIFQ